MARGLLLIPLLVIACGRAPVAPDAQPAARTATVAASPVASTTTAAEPRRIHIGTSTLADEPELGGRAMTAFEQELMRHSLERYTGDLEVIQKRKVLRVLTRNNSSNYFISNGQQRGFQYELAKAFADELGVRLAVIVPSSRGALETALLEGEGDMIAAGTTITATRARRLAFSHPVRTSDRVLVLPRKGGPSVARPGELAAVRIHVSFRSTTHEALLALAKEHKLALQLVDVTDDVEMEEMIERVAAGEYAATVADRDIADLAIAAGARVRAGLTIGAPVAHGWVFRPDSPALAAAGDRFVRVHRTGGLIKILHDRYFKSARASTRDPALRADQAGTLSRWDAVFQREGAKHDLDWRLLAAIAFSESRFDAAAKSDWGAVGLMQVLPTTAKPYGVTRLEDPAENIKAGAAYFRYLVDRFDDPQVEPRQRIRFALAAYNAGLGHVFDARALAPKIGKNPAVWFGNVEEALRLKKDRKWHEQTRFGFCRADETIGYVSKVQSTYDVFARHQAVEASPARK